MNKKIILMVSVLLIFFSIFELSPMHRPEESVEAEIIEQPELDIGRDRYDAYVRESQEIDFFEGRAQAFWNRAKHSSSPLSILNISDSVLFDAFKAIVNEFKPYVRLTFVQELASFEPASQTVSRDIASGTQRILSKALIALQEALRQKHGWDNKTIDSEIFFKMFVEPLHAKRIDMSEWPLKV